MIFDLISPKNDQRSFVIEKQHANLWHNEKPTFYVYLTEGQSQILIGKVIDDENQKGYNFSILDSNDWLLYRILDKHLIKEVSWT